MADPVTAGRPASIRRRFSGLRWRVAAVVDRLTLWWRLPPRPADGWVRSSRYVTVRDGTRIAVDVYHPTRRGSKLEGRLPVVWSFDRYHRARLENGRLWTRLDSESWLKSLVCRGYVVGVADVRGSGASFGSRAGLLGDDDRRDAYDITEWWAAQPWSNGRIGMCGKSFMGMTQFLAASTAPPHLVAIAPERTPFDLYDFAYAGGVFRDDYAREWGKNTNDLDRTRPAAPVDEDDDGRLLSAAMAEHRANGDIHELFAGLPLRDSRGAAAHCPYEEQSLATYRQHVAASNVAVLQFAGWSDMWARDALLWHVNLPNPRRLIIGPWAHTHDAGWKWFAERLRWFDYWLKEIDNGVPNEAPIRYYTTGPPRHAGWRTASQWPLPVAQARRFYCSRANGGGTASAPTLIDWPPQAAGGGDRYVVDYTTSSGAGTRWKNGYGREFEYPDMAANDAKALTYTTSPLDEELEVTGHPIACLWVSVEGGDADIFVYLEEVRPDGYSGYVTEGVLRASHRAVAAAPFDNLGLPYHPSTAATVAPPPPGAAVALTFDLHPISRVFRRGHRIRLAITGADAGNALTPAVQPPPVVTLHRHPRGASHVVLPVIPSGRR